MCLPFVEVPSFEEVSASKEAYARANMVEYDEHDPFVGKAILQKHGRQFLLVNPPAYPLTTAELDAVAELPYVREPHPMYDSMGGVPAIEEVRFSITHNRGALGRAASAPWPFTRGAPSPPAATSLFSGRQRPSPATPASRAISTTWAAPLPPSAVPPARNSSSTVCAGTGPVCAGALPQPGRRPH